MYIARQFRFIIIIILGVMSTPVFASSDTSAANTDLTKKLEQIMQTKIPTAAIGMVVQDADSGQILYSQRADEPFPPASNTKLFTAASSLLILGPDYRYQTTLQLDKGALHEGVLKDNVYLVMQGDPSLTSDDLSALLTQLKNLPVQTIDGDMVIDTSWFALPLYAPGNTQDSLNWYYSAPVSAAILDENKVTVRITPSTRLNQPAVLQLQRKGPLDVPIHGQVNTVSFATAKDWCQLLLTVGNDNTIQLGGCWPKYNYSTHLKIAVKNPEMMLQQWVEAKLAELNIQVNGEVRLGNAPTTLATLDQIQSEPLSMLLQPMLQDSDNLIADSVLKTLGATQYQQGTFQAGVNAMEAVLTERLDLTAHDLKLFDGSGLSRYNLVTPETIAKLLMMMYRTEEYPYFSQALAQSGTSGTLEWRFRTRDLTAKLRAKTGRISGVVTLSGYLTTQQGKTLIVVIMLDHFTQDVHQAYDFQTKVLSTLYRYQL